MKRMQSIVELWINPVLQIYLVGYRNVPHLYACRTIGQILVYTRGQGQSAHHACPYAISVYVRLHSFHQNPYSILFILLLKNSKAARPVQHKAAQPCCDEWTFPSFLENRETAYGLDFLLVGHTFLPSRIDFHTDIDIR